MPHTRCMPGMVFSEEIVALASELCPAVSEYRILELRHPPATTIRLVEPHSVEVAQAGAVILVAWQRIGPSVSGSYAGWKNFAI